MAIEVITGAAFAGKSEFANQEIAARERDGVLGLVLVSYSAVFHALIPGEQSSYRDESLADTGASRLAGSAFDFAIGAVALRQLSGFIAVQSPRRALSLSDRFGGATVWDVTASPDALAVRVASHAADLGRRVPRAGNAEANCRRAVLGYLNERPVLVGRAREVRQTRRGSYEKGATVQAFNEELFIKGLTPAGRQARDQLIEAGNGSPSPADVFRQVMTNLGRRR